MLSLSLPVDPLFHLPIHLAHQDVQGLRAQASGEISMHLECAESSILSQQLEMFRDESLKAMIDKNQAQNNNWFNAQVSRITTLF